MCRGKEGMCGSGGAEKQDTGDAEAGLALCIVRVYRLWTDVRSALQLGKECVADAFLVDAAEVAQDVDGAMLDKAVWNT